MHHFIYRAEMYFSSAIFRVSTPTILRASFWNCHPWLIRWPLHHNVPLGSVEAEGPHPIIRINYEPIFGSHKSRLQQMDLMCASQQKKKKKKFYPHSPHYRNPVCILCFLCNFQNHNMHGLSDGPPTYEMIHLGRSYWDHFRPDLI